MRDSLTTARRSAPWRRPLIGLSGLQALAVLGQAWLAGGFLTGSGAALAAHRNMAFGVIQWIGFGTLILAILWWRPGRGPVWPIAVAAVSLVAIGVQIAAGFADLLQVHVPLGVFIFGLNLWLVVRLFRYER